MKNFFVGLMGVLTLITLTFVGFASIGGQSEVEYVEEMAVREEKIVKQINEPEEEAVARVEEESECLLLDDFTGSSDLQWYTVNDGVMGGLSTGSARIEENQLVHFGEIVTRGGGFSYVGTRLPNGVLVGYSSLQVRFKSYGRAYALNLADSRSWRVTHQAPIPVGGEDEWQEVSIDFIDTVPTIFSRQVNATPFDPSAVEELAFILSDGVDAPFRTRIDWVKACR